MAKARLVASMWKYNPCWRGLEDHNLAVVLQKIAVIIVDAACHFAEESTVHPDEIRGGPLYRSRSLSALVRADIGLSNRSNKSAVSSMLSRW